ncbi:Hypothetical predicted protein [Cloeon dipterum]|uniref:TAZ-type domain-containing protein n=1 Tax=Cloeon dipterum TaxID=197152 RepID=A0A8S1DTC8_9INSE|nr:Hypothetical predicted protein [Cloeon dipterum]
MHLILPEIEDPEQVLVAHCQYRKLWRQEEGFECPLLHVVQCNQSNCTKLNCDERKKMFRQHAEVMVCMRNAEEGRCNDCAIIERATVDHSTFCIVIDCPVPKCNKIKAQKLVMRKIRQNQRNVVARKRQKSNQDYSDCSSDSDNEDYEDGYYESKHVGLQKEEQSPYEEDSDEDEHDESIMHNRNNNKSQEWKRGTLITEIINAVYKTNFVEWRSMMDNNDNKARSQVLMKLLDAFNEAGVLYPFPQDTSDEEIYSDEYDG